LFAWLVVALTLLIGYEVFSRYFLNSPHTWALDVQVMLFGSMFMMVGAYALSKNAHVRGDVLYGFLKPRTQAAFDLVLYLLFFLPGVTALIYAGYFFALDSWQTLERSPSTSDGPPLYPFKTMIPLAGAFLILQGLVEILRCLVCLKTGEWPSRESDVEEVDIEEAKAVVAGIDDVKSA
jgi:TRAP-type mannitol/chloroaromatic compound transport system permease small subunit